ncbi:MULTISPECIES: metalloregulator ArsR/SmtB family transcription factor [Marinobacter]|uniref:metalloregulator ArsR/SmtB family transcription factor n=1 Tax=Marinobacter TaxID=2742 RepID=UPI001D091B97|nr:MULTISPECIES: metalloregulator ArsR/SmtB family transcription factor [Marinobacter]MCK7567518.1 metalloregulator ArsR/SmtB family transcription factor [Marinobacter xestospongiae]UDL04900.1 metalloregulator ArsR/SmtB family transcription factor [Marinobacter sp. CA1]
MSKKRRVLFVCTANSARSQMAEALLRSIAGDQFIVASAGTAPTTPHPLALQCLSDAGIDSTELRAKSISEVSQEHWDYVITLCDKASRECQPMASMGQMIAWDFPDPVPGNRPSGFALVMKELRERISLFVLVHQKDSHRPIHYPPAGVFKALGDDNRLAALLLIQLYEELCVCELTAAMELSQPRISRFLAQLREQALVEDERRGQWIYYRLHPALPDWLLTTLHAAAAENTSVLAPMTQRLDAMPNRPARTACQ